MYQFVAVDVDCCQLQNIYMRTLYILITNKPGNSIFNGSNGKNLELISYRSKIDYQSLLKYPNRPGIFDY